MIVSHKHRFIFVKPRKVAGTSVEVNLAKQCGADDIVTPVSGFSAEGDEDTYEQQARNHDGFFNHMPPELIKEAIGEEIWNSYTKITIVRNPWDLMVSRWWWDKERGFSGEQVISRGKRQSLLKKLLSTAFFQRAPAVFYRIFRKIKLKLIGYDPNRFSDFILNLPNRYIAPIYYNTNFYFDSDGSPLAQYYLRYESLEADYKNLCEKLGLPYEALPRLKTKQRKKKDHYSLYYDDKTQARLYKLFSQEIAYFEYKFNPAEVK